MRLQRDENESVLAALAGLPELCRLFLADGEPPPSVIYRALHDQPLEALLLLQSYCQDSRIWKGTTLYWERLRHIQPSVSGNDLIKLGMAPGPCFQAALSAVHDALLDGRVKSREEELALAVEILGLAPGTRKESC